MVQSEEHANAKNVELEDQSTQDVEAATPKMPTDHQVEDEDEDRHVEADAKLLDNGNAMAHGNMAGANEKTDQTKAKAKAKLKREKSEQDRLITEDINKLLDEMPLEKNVACGFWIFRGAFFQRWVVNRI